MHRIGSPLALPGLATPVDFQPEQNKIQTKENKQTEAGNMKLKKQEKPKPKLNPKKKKTTKWVSPPSTTNNNNNKKRLDLTAAHGNKNRKIRRINTRIMTPQQQHQQQA
jgi:Tfp pilus assembly major pilin PilA